MYLVYFQGADFFTQNYFVDFNKAKEVFDKCSVDYADYLYGDPCEKVLALIELKDGDEVSSGTWNELISRNIIEEFDFEN
jgi:hypothetical protein